MNIEASTNDWWHYFFPLSPAFKFVILLLVFPDPAASDAGPSRSLSQYAKTRVWSKFTVSVFFHLFSRCLCVRVCSLCEPKLLWEHSLSPYTHTLSLSLFSLFQFYLFPFNPSPATSLLAWRCCYSRVGSAVVSLHRAKSILMSQYSHQPTLQTVISAAFSLTLFFYFLSVLCLFFSQCNNLFNLLVSSKQTWCYSFWLFTTLWPKFTKCAVSFFYSPL